MAELIPPGMTLDTLLAPAPDEPLPNIAGFDHLDKDAGHQRILALNHWIESQATCNTIIRWHGAKGLQRVLSGIARASSAKKVPMQPRVKSIAGYLGLKIV